MCVCTLGFSLSLVVGPFGIGYFTETYVNGQPSHTCETLQYGGVRVIGILTSILANPRVRLSPSCVCSSPSIVCLFRSVGVRLSVGRYRSQAHAHTKLPKGHIGQREGKNHGGQTSAVTRCMHCTPETIEGTRSGRE